MEIIRAGSRPTNPGPADWFTGEVWIDEVVAVQAPERPGSLRVTFTPGARTAWHTHPAGQTLHVTVGTGRVGRADGSIEQINAGDTVWFEPGERHWHGAGPDTLMTHIAIQAADASGEVVTWAEHVTDEQYAGR